MKRFAGQCALALLLSWWLVALEGRAEEIRELSGERWGLVRIAEERFEEDWRDRWILEGNATLQVSAGRLSIVTTQEPGLEPAATLWWKEALPSDVLIELTAGVDSLADGNAANLNLIFAAAEREGPYRFGRSGRYSEYQEIPNYIVTLTGGFQTGWSRVRRNPGFVPLSEERSTRSEVGQTYRIRLLVAAGRIRYWRNEQLIHDVRDPQPLSGGHFALRTWRSRVWWSGITIYRVRSL